MGMIYKARDETLDREVAIKFLLPERVGGAEASARFLREARAVARLSHPHIMTLFDVGREGAWHYLVLEYIPGQDLHSLMRARGEALPLREAMQVIRGVLAALAYAHDLNLVHRDIKPANIMVTAAGQVKVADFGLAMARGQARLTQEGTIVGTALYLAPELVTGAEADQRTDLYAVGAILYELLTGQPPFAGDNLMTIFSRILTAPLTAPRTLAPGLPPAVEQIILKLLARDPNDRYASADEVLAALPAEAESEPAPADPTAAKHASLRLHLFGPFRLLRSGESLVLPTRKAEALCAYLALHPGQHTREELATRFWGDSPDEDARRSLRVALSALRKVLGDDALLADRETLQLNPTYPLWVDAVEFKSLISNLQLLITDHSSLITLYRGPLLADFYDDWALLLRDEYHALYVDALLRLIERQRSQGEYARVIELAQRLLAVDPADERAHQHLMIGYEAIGDRHAALKQYEECKRRLWEDLAVEPAPETTALYERIRQTSAPVKSLTAALTNLPTPLTSFIGRQQALAEVKRLLTPTPWPKAGEGVRLLTLTGAGGTGKTRLAIQAAGDLVEIYPDGVWWVELGVLDYAELLPQAVAKVLGLQESAVEPLTTTLVNYLRLREALLVLDNCEHLIEACASLAEGLLSRCPQLHLLATSREALGLSGEVVWRVPTLSLPAAGAAFDQLMKWEGIGLFVERAGAVQPGFTLTKANAGAVFQICRQLDGIPLAIELAAARLKALSVEQIAARLRDRFKLLTTGSRTALPRQQTLRALMDWSYDLLSEPERALFRRLAVFVGGRTLEAVEAVCSEQRAVSSEQRAVSSEQRAVNSEQRAVSSEQRAVNSEQRPLNTVHSSLFTEDVLDVLTRLVDKSLVIVETRPGEDARYQMLETVWEYAREKLAEAGELAELQDRHLAYYADWMEQTAPQIQGPEQTLWIRRMEAEQPNLRAALDWAMSKRAADPQAGFRLAAASGLFWLTAGFLHEGLERLLALAPRSAGLADPGLRGRLLFRAGALALELSRMEEARELCRQGVALCREAGNRLSLADGLYNLAQVAHTGGGLAEARAALEECVTLNREINHLSNLNNALTSLASVLHDQEERAAARAILDEALAIATQVNDTWGRGFALRVLADMRLAQGEYDGAWTAYEQSLEAMRAMNDRVNVGAVLEKLAMTASLRGDHEPARRFADEALDWFQALGHAIYRPFLIRLLGYAALGRGELGTAAAHFAESLRLNRALGEHHNIGVLGGFIGLAAAALSQDDPARAARLCAAAEAHRPAMPRPLMPPDVMMLGRVLPAARAQLDEAAFAAAWAEGQAMTLEEAVRYALESLPDSTAQSV